MKKNKPSFVLFKLPHSPTLYCLDTSEKGTKAITFVNFLANKKKHFQSNHIKIVTELQLLESYLDIELIENNINNTITKDTYVTKVEKALQKIADNELSKVIISQKFIEKYIQNPIIHFISLTHKYPSAFCYLLYENASNCWIGATPELLLKIQNNNLETMALAGTLANNDALVWSAKEQVEHQWVTDYIVKKIEAFSQNITVKNTETLYLNQLKHLKTTIIAKLLSQTKTHKIIKKLHPTSAICGIPLANAEKFIMETENYDRELYTGYIQLNINNIEYVYVNLRCAKLYKNSIEKFVGGGIIAISDPEKEWEELLLKRKYLDVF